MNTFGLFYYIYPNLSFFPFPITSLVSTLYTPISSSQPSSPLHLHLHFSILSILTPLHLYVPTPLYTSTKPSLPFYSSPPLHLHVHNFTPFHLIPPFYITLHLHTSHHLYKYVGMINDLHLYEVDTLSQNGAKMCQMQVLDI